MDREYVVVQSEVFVAGDLAAKVDPYMRPLFHALYDTMDADRAMVMRQALSS